MATMILTLFKAQQNITTAKHRVTVFETAAGPESAGKRGQKPEITWSEWQDLNLRPLRPERVPALENR
jgi:hypothetical protein